MSLTIKAFGMTAEATSQKEFLLPHFIRIKDLRKYLEEQFPVLSTMRYVISVNKKIVNEDISIADHSEIALLPPFSGG